MLAPGLDRGPFERTAPVHKSFVTLSVVSLCLSLAGGCGDRPEEQAEQRLNAALQAIQQAERGFTAEGVERPEDLQAHRQSHLDRAVPELQAVLQNGSPEQRSLAARLLADIHASAANHLARSAADEYAALAARAGTLLGYLSALDEAAQRTRLLSSDTGETEQSLNEQIQQTRQQQSELAAQVEQIDQEIAQLAQERETAQTQASQLAGEAQQLRQQAFTADGDARYDLEDQAAEVDRQVAEQAVVADVRQTRMDVLEAQKRVVQANLNMQGQVLARLTDQVQQRQAQGQAAQQSLAEAQAARGEALTALQNEFSQVLSVYRQAVEEPLARAVERSQQAVQQLESVQSVGGAARSAVEADLLAKQLAQVHLISEQAMMAEGMARIVGMLASRAQDLMPEQADAYRQLHQQLTQRHEALVAEAQQVAQVGQQLAQEIGDDMALQQAERLEGYVARLSGQTVPPEPAAEPVAPETEQPMEPAVDEVEQVG